jgi:peptidoglycan hydrolase CwlO-like protein
MIRTNKTTALKRIVVFLLIIATVCCSAFAASATELSDKQNEKDEIQSELDNIQGEKDEIKDQLGNSQDALSQAEREKKIQESIKQDRIAELQALRKDIETLDKEIKAAEEEFAKKEALFIERAKIMYQYSDYSLLDMFLQSDDIFMFFEKISTYRKMLQHDKNLMNEITVLKETLTHMKKLQEKTFANQEQLIVEIDKAIKALEADIELKQDDYATLLGTLNEIEANEESLAEDLKEVDNEIARLEYEEQLRKEEEAAKNESSNSGSSSSGSSSKPSSSGTSSSGYIFPLSKSGYVYFSSKYGINWFTFHVGSQEGFYPNKISECKHVLPESWHETSFKIEQFATEHNLHVYIPKVFLNEKEYEIYKNAGLKEVEIGGKPALIRDDIDWDQTDEKGKTGRIPALDAGADPAFAHWAGPYAFRATGRHGHAVAFRPGQPVKY